MSSSICFLLLLRLINLLDLSFIISLSIVVNNSTPYFEQLSLPPAFIIGPIKKPRSSIVNFFLKLCISNIKLNTELFFKDLIIPMSPYLFIFTGIFVLVGSSNAVNLTDGLDGLAILPSVLIGGALGIIAYSMGNQFIADYLYLPHLPLSGELIVFCGALIGSGIGFLWYNTYPAQVFMGDIGSLSLGAILGIIAIILRHELVFAIMAGVFVVETLSVAIQVISIKTRGKRVFLMAPIHHHYELKGMAEPKIIVRFWIITLVLILIALATLKLR